MQSKFEALVALKRFNIKEGIDAIRAYEKHTKEIQEIVDICGEKMAKAIIRSLTRFSVFIEPVKEPKIDSTKFQYRWGLSQADLRYSSYENCLTIFAALLKKMSAILKEDGKVDALRLILSHPMVSYDLNLDYVNRITDNPIHTVENIDFFWEEQFITAYMLRKFLLENTKGDMYEFIYSVLIKIATKAYLTDRVLTGTYKTNREKRWECHPLSVHFALRKDALMIERKLLKQICYMQGFPEELRKKLIEASLLEKESEITRCPITLDVINFEEFQKETISPVHGKSAFQVGHLHPLKSTEAGENIGHVADNISWVSQDGNRIQGDLSVEETRELLARISANYTADRSGK